MSVAAKKILNKKRLASRVRFKLALRRNGRPRLSVFCSNNHIYTQIIDDVNGVTLTSASTLSPELKGLEQKNVIEAATRVGQLISEKAKNIGIKEVVFDRGNRLYHGKIKALADAARTNLIF